MAMLNPTQCPPDAHKEYVNMDVLRLLHTNPDLVRVLEEKSNAL